jgi:hypothetical protein
MLYGKGKDPVCPNGNEPIEVEKMVGDRAERARHKNRPSQTTQSAVS